MKHATLTEEQNRYLICALLPLHPQVRWNGRLYRVDGVVNGKIVCHPEDNPDRTFRFGFNSVRVVRRAKDEGILLSKINNLLGYVPED